MNATNNTIYLNAHNVVQNDKIQQATTRNAMKNSIEQLAAEREAWQTNAMRTSNEQLYALLQKCYGLYKKMEGKDESPLCQTTCRAHRTVKLGALMEEQVGQIRTSIQGQSRGAVAAA